MKLPVTRSSLGDPVVVLGLELICLEYGFTREKSLKCEVTSDTIVLRGPCPLAGRSNPVTNTYSSSSRSSDIKQCWLHYICYAQITVLKRNQEEE